MGFAEVFEDEVPFITTSQMIEVDRAMIEDFGIVLLQMMENAGRNLAHVARHAFLDGDPRGCSVAVLAGPGGNGGGALVSARRLANWGANVRVYLATPRARLTEAVRHQLHAVEAMGVAVRSVESVESAGPAGDGVESSAPGWSLVVDGLIGYRLAGDPRGGAAALIEWVNRQSAPVLSLDVPSGVDAASGRVGRPAVHANATLTLALPKTGMREPLARSLMGDLYLADISVPPSLYRLPALELSVAPLFATADVVRVVTR